MRDITVQAFPEGEFIGLVIPAQIVRSALVPGADAVIVRFRSPEGFKRFMVAAMDAAAEVWPDIAKEWLTMLGEAN